jgi:hypothetical protein
MSGNHGIPDRKVLGRKNGHALWHCLAWVGHVSILTFRLDALARSRVAQINSQNPTQDNFQNHRTIPRSSNITHDNVLYHG